MNQNKENRSIQEQDFEKSNRNEEDLLSFSSKYKTNINKEEDVKEKEIEQKEIRKKILEKSTSISQEYSNISRCNLKKINTLPNEEENNHKTSKFDDFSKIYDEFQEKQRKLSSPICCYYDGSDIYLSKTQKNIINMNNSPNFIKKNSFFSNSDKIDDKTISNFKVNNNTQNDINDNNINKNLFFQNQNISSIEKNNNENKKNVKINELKICPNNIQMNYINNINRIQNNNIINNNFFFPSNNFQQQIFNINYININNFPNNQINQIKNNFSRRKLTYNIEDGIIGNYFNNILNQNNNNRNANEQFFNIPQTQTKFNPILFSYNEEQDKLTKFDINKKSSNKSIPNNKNEKKPFDKRKGDWLCPECHNLNFAFRVVCNRCQLPKPDNLAKAKGQ